MMAAKRRAGMLRTTRQGQTHADFARELARGEATAELIRRCVAPSPRRDAWLAGTEAANARLRRHLRERLRPHRREG